MNRIIEIMSNAFRDSCIKLKCIEPQGNMEAEVLLEKLYRITKIC